MTWIALTGVNGFIGHNLALELLKDPKIESILGADLPTTVSRQTHHRNTANSNFHFCTAEQFIAELEERETLWGTPPMAVIHNGACSSTTETDPEVFRKLNVESSQELFEYCSRKGVPFLYASSASVYGDGNLGFDDSSEKNGQYKPLNLYGQSKHQFDTWVLQQDQRPPTWFGLRYFNVFGPHEEHKGKQASILYWGSEQIKQSGVLKLFKSHRPDIADGKQRRDFVSVFDVVRVTLGLLQVALQGTDLPEQGCFVNIGRGEAASWLDTARALFASLGQEVKIEFIDMPQQLQEHYQNFTQAELSTLHRLGLSEPFL